MKPRELQTKVVARQGRIGDELIFQYDNLFHVLSVNIRHLAKNQPQSGAGRVEKKREQWIEKRSSDS